MENNNGKPVNIGRIGEGIACDYLIKNKWKLIARNYRIGFDEIDIIASSFDKPLVFFEVKTRKINSSSWSLKAEDNLTPQKIKKISRACRWFAERNAKLIDEEWGWRIDLLAIDLGFNNIVLDIRHYENIYPA